MSKDSIGRERSTYQLLIDELIETDNTRITKVANTKKIDTTKAKIDR